MKTLKTYKTSWGWKKAVQKYRERHGQLDIYYDRRGNQTAILCNPFSGLERPVGDWNGKTGIVYD